MENLEVSRWIHQMVGHVYSVLGELPGTEAIRWSNVACATDVGIVLLEERCSGALDPYIRFLDSSFQLCRVKSEESILILEIINRDNNTFNPDF